MQLGTGTSTIGAGGCLLTDFTMAVNALLGTSYDVGDVNALLQNAGAFIGSGLVMDKAAAALGLEITARIRGPNAVELLEVVDGALARGGVAIVAVDHNGDGDGDHFVLVDEREGSGYRAADSAPAKFIELRRVGDELSGDSRWSSTSTKRYRACGAVGLVVPGAPAARAGRLLLVLALLAGGAFAVRRARASGWGWR